MKCGHRVIQLHGILRLEKNEVEKSTNLTCESNEHAHLALAEVLSQIKGEIVVVSGDAEGLRSQMQPHLESMGIKIESTTSWSQQ